MLKLRLITGPILILILIGIVWLDTYLEEVSTSLPFGWTLGDSSHLPTGAAFFVLALLAVVLASRELTTIFTAQGIRAKTWLIVLGAEFALVFCFFVPSSTDAWMAVAILATALFALFVIALLVFSRGKQVQGVIASAGAVLFATVYLGLMLGVLLALRREHSAWWIVGVILVTKSGDIGAYFTGKAIGKHKLIPWLSPGKTWEGLIGGMVFAALVGAGFAALSVRLEATGDHVPLWLGLTCGVAFTWAGLLGDLTMSLMKRSAGLKDASATLPGLGGVMDVLDSPLFVAPLAYWMLSLLV